MDGGFCFDSTGEHETPEKKVDSSNFSSKHIVLRRRDTIRHIDTTPVILLSHLELTTIDKFCGQQLALSVEHHDVSLYDNYLVVSLYCCFFNCTIQTLPPRSGLIPFLKMHFYCTRIDYCLLPPQSTNQNRFILHQNSGNLRQNFAPLAPNAFDKNEPRAIRLSRNTSPPFISFGSFL
jgi:hypothetical protein